MTDLQQLLADVLTPGVGSPVVTLYLDTAWHDEQQRERVRIFFHERAREAEKLFVDGVGDDGVRAALRVLGEYVDGVVNQEVHPAAGGLFVVADARGIVLELASPEPFEPAMYVDRQPHLFALVDALSAVQRAALVLVEAAGGQILTWQAGEVTDEAAVERDIGRRHRAGGWSAHRIQARVKVHTRDAWREVVTRLVELDPSAIVLFGTAENVRGFAKQVPASLQSRLADTRPMPPTRAGLLEAARDALREDRFTRDVARAHSVFGDAAAGRGAVAGLLETLEAVNARQVHELVLSRTFDVTGFSCDACGAVWPQGGEGCVFCGKPTRLVPLAEELVRRTLAQGALVSIVGAGSPLESVRGLGARTRRTSREALRTAPGAIARPPA